MFKKNISLYLFAVVTVLVAIGCQSSVSHASNTSGDIFSRFKKDMPKVELLSDEEFKKLTKQVKKKPYGDKALAYKIRIPEKWTEKESGSSSNFVLSSKLFLELSSFYGKPTVDGRSRIEISVLKLERNLTAEQWYLKYIIEGGFATHGFVVHNKKKAESLMILLEKDRSYYLRTVVILNGNSVIMMRYYVPVGNMQKEAVMQAQVSESFEVLYEMDRPLEKMMIYSFLDIIDLKYPKEWKVYTNPVRDVDRMSVTVMNTKEYFDLHGALSSTSTDAKLDVTVVSSSSQSTLVEEVAKYKQKMEADGLLIGKKIANRDEYKYSDNMDFALTEIYEGGDGSSEFNEYEFWFTVMVGGNYYYFLNLLTPSRNDNFGVWAENTQHYKRIIKEMSPMTGAFLERDY
ncbi:MAG: hypothetical protein ACRBB3_00770 [Alphaproteobacteria bacterium]